MVIIYIKCINNYVNNYRKYILSDFSETLYEKSIFYTILILIFKMLRIFVVLYNYVLSLLLKRKREKIKFILLFILNVL